MIYFAITLTGLFALTVSLTMIKKFQPKDITETGKEKCPKCKGKFNTGDSLSTIYAPIALVGVLLGFLFLKSDKTEAGLVGSKATLRRIIVAIFYIGGCFILVRVKQTFKKDLGMVEHFRLLACSMLLIALFYFLPVWILRLLKIDCLEDYISTIIEFKP